MRPFERRIYYGITIIVLTFLPIILAAFLSVHKIFDEERNVIALNARRLAQAQQLRYIDSTLSSIMPVYVLSGENRLLDQFASQYRRFDDVAIQLESTESDPSVHRLIEQIVDLSLKLRNLAVPGIDLRKKGASIEQVNAYFVKNAEPTTEKIASLLKELVNDESGELEAAKVRLARTVNWVIAGLVLLSSVAVSLLAFSGRLIIQAIKQKRAIDDVQEDLFKHEQRVSQARREAVEIVSHDLKNPLGTLKMSLEMMLDDARQGCTIAELKKGLEIGYRAAESMELLIKNLLDHAKIEAGQLILERKYTNLCGLIQELSQRFELLAQNKKITLRTELKGGVLPVNIDASRIEQVLSNLIGNALKFTATGGFIKISAGMDGDDILVTVEDNGNGIEPNHLPHIFDRFWQSKETASFGNGLGLTIAKVIIEAHGGRIWAESEVGRGSVLSFSLPRAKGIHEHRGILDL